MNKNVLVVAVHPDDETLGAGGTLLKYASLGYSLHWLIVTGAKEEYGYDVDRVKTREKEIEQVSLMYNFDSVHQLNFKPAGLDTYSISDIIEAVSSVFNKVQPDIVILPNMTDAHSDHSVAFNAAFSCTKTFRYPFVKTILTMEVLSETNFGYPQDFLATYFVDISSTFERKIEIMKEYRSELNAHPFPRSIRAIESLSTLRGSQVGVNYAEAFHLIKHIEE